MILAGFSRQEKQKAPPSFKGTPHSRQTNPSMRDRRSQQEPQNPSSSSDSNGVRHPAHAHGRKKRKTQESKRGINVNSEIRILGSEIRTQNSTRHPRIE